MHKARAFFYVSAGLLCLALAYHLGARSAGAQAGSMIYGVSVADLSGVGCGAEVFVLTPNGDLFRRPYSCGQLTESASCVGNFWSGGPTPAVSQPTWGQVKARYATPAPGKAGRVKPER